MATPTSNQNLMSSRLMNMKFMQRGGPSPPTTPSSEPPAKRPRLSSGAASTPAHAATPTAPDLARRRFLEQQARVTGETQWVLSVAPPSSTDADANGTGAGMRVRTVGFAAIDGGEGKAVDEEDDDEEADEEGEVAQTTGRTGTIATVGRRTYGDFQRTETAMQPPPTDEKPPDSGSDSGSDSDDFDSDDFESDDSDSDDVDGRSRSPRTHASGGSSHRNPAPEVDLRQVKSISSGGTRGGGGFGKSRGGFGSHGGIANVSCYRCGKKGHVKARCPER